MRMNTPESEARVARVLIGLRGKMSSAALVEALRLLSTDELREVIERLKPMSRANAAGVG